MNKADKASSIEEPGANHSSVGASASFNYSRLILLLLLLLAAGVRIYASVFSTCRTHTDDFVNAMMVQHIAEGRHFPLMLYNSCYLGTWELYLCALFYRFMSHSLLPSLLGFAFITLAALPLFYLWARRMFGTRAALYGLALLVIGPVEFFNRGVFMGYPTLILCGMAMCLLMLRIVDRLKDRHRIWPEALLLGFATGIGWWTTNLIIVFLPACALLVVFGVPWKKWASLFLYCAAGGLIGAAPWIIYSINQIDALQFATDVSLSKGGFVLQNVWRAFLMTLSLMDFGFSSARPIHAAASAILVILLIAALIPVIHRGQRDPARFRHLAVQIMPWLIIATNIIACAVSRRFIHIPAVRYLLPALPAIAALAGKGAARLDTLRLLRFRHTGLLCIFVIVCAHAVQIPNIWDKSHQNLVRGIRQRVEDLTAFREDKGIDAFYGDFRLQWMSFASGERLKITSFPYYFDRYRPFRDAAVLTTNLAVLNDYHGVTRFLEATAGSAKVGQAGGAFVHWNIRRDPPVFTHLDRAEIESAMWDDGSSAMDLMDDNLDTPGHMDKERPKITERTVHLRFSSPQRVVGLHAWGPSGSWAEILRVSAPGKDGEKTALHDGLFYNWFWSGQYPFLSGFMAHFETIFHPVTTEELWITVNAIEKTGLPLVSELRVLIEESPHTPDLPEDKQLDDEQYAELLIEQIREYPPAMLYAPRWIAERARRSLPFVSNVVPADYYEQYEGVDRYLYHPVIRMNRIDGALLVVPTTAADRTIRVLRQRGWIIEDASILGKWELLRVRNNERSDASDRLYWTEYGAFLANDPFRAQDSQALAGVPLIETPVRFGRGMILESVAIETARLRPGSSATMVYKWNCPPNINPKRLAVFVHFIKDNQTRFQDDHVWLGNIPDDALTEQPKGWIFTTVRKFTVPHDAPPGDYSIAVGLYDRVTMQRLKPRGNVLLKDKAVIMEQAVEVPIYGGQDGG